MKNSNRIYSKKKTFFSKVLCFLLIISGSLLTNNAYASKGIDESMQQRVITGTVVDDTGEVMIGVTVKVKDMSAGTVTDIDGKYSLPLPEGAKELEFTYVGFDTKVVAIGSSAVVDVVMSTDAKLLDQVVVTALGMKRSEKSLGYAMKELKGDELNTNLINPVSALQGKVAGVDISNSDGGMFGSTKIQIRGVSTLSKTGNQPIYVVDGVILSNQGWEAPSADWDDSAQDYGNELKNLNPDDFETVSVLKGAAATALYGSRGLNGAVVITTKSGKSGQGVGVNFSQTFGFDKVTSAPNLQNSFGTGVRSGAVKYGDKDASGEYYKFDNYRQFYYSDGMASLIHPNSNRSWGPAFDGREIQYYDGTTRAYNAEKNNFKDAYSTGFNSNTNVAINGGNDRTTFYTSLSFKHATGIIPNNEFQRFSVLGKASHKITNKVKLDFSMSFANSTPKNPEKNIGENFVSGVWGRSYDPSYGKNKYKGAHGGLASTSYGDEYGNMPGRGTWWSIYENTYEQKETVVRPVVKLEVDLLDWLKWNTEGSYNYYYTRYEAKELGSGYANEGGFYEMKLNTQEQTNLNTNFVVNKTLGDWNINGFLRGEYYENFRQYQQMKTEGGLIVPGQYFIGNSKDTPKYSAIITDKKKMLSVAFQAGFGWKDQVYVDVTGRNDWSSSLVYTDGHGTYSYFYPSVNGSWLVSNTFRDKLPEWITFAKLRASWAQVGNDTDSYYVNNAYDVKSYAGLSGNYYGLTISDNLKSQHLKPERKNAWEVGLDWRFFDNRFGVDFTYYKENTKNQIMTIDVPYESGISKQLINAGNIQNKGIELAVNFVPIRNKDWEWDVNLTYTKNDNKIISLHENVADYIVLAGDATYGNYRMASVAKVGSSYGTLMTDSAIEYDESSGLPILHWQDSDRGAHYKRNYEDIKEIGSMIPDFLGSVSTTLKYKNWSLAVALDMRFGGYVASYNL